MSEDTELGYLRFGGNTDIQRGHTGGFICN